MLPLAVEFAIGSCTGLLDCCLFHPLDTLKVRRQDGRPLLMDVRSGLPLRRTGGGLRFLAACVGSLYAGFTTNLSLKVPYMAMMFAFNALNTRLLARLGGDGTATELASAALVGVEVSLLLSPLEMIRIQGQNRGKGGLITATAAVAATAHGRGAWGWWRAWTRGMTATMHRETKYCAGQFFLCERLAKLAEEALCAQPGCEQPGGGAPPSIGSQVVGAVLGGVACTAVSHPDDVIKTRMQTHLLGSPLHGRYATFLGSGLHVVRHEGVLALFNGAAFRCLLRVPLGLSVIMVSGRWMRDRAERWQPSAGGPPQGRT